MRIFLLASLLSLTACQHAASSPSGGAPEADQSSTRPDEAATAQETVFARLPLVASLSQLPWPSSSWPSAKGGASFRWKAAKPLESEELDELDPFIHYTIGSGVLPGELAPSEKFDLWQGDSGWSLTRRERARTLDQKNADGSPRRELPEWEGLMHAWAQAALQFKPVGPVRLQNPAGKWVHFEAQDVYALLALAVHEQAARKELLASGCPGSGDATAAADPYGFENAKQKLRRQNCPALDPARFHLALGNQIGKRNSGVIFDRDNEGEISSHPVAAYETRILQRQETADGSLIQLHTAVFMTEEAAVNLDDMSTYPYESEMYAYELQLNKKGEVTGGRWLDHPEANAQIPDFVWTSKAVWLNGPLRTLYEAAQAEKPALVQLRPIEDMPGDERQSLNAFWRGNVSETKTY